MNKVLVSLAAAATLAGAAGFSYAQQATTGQNQSNPRVTQEQGPVGTTPTPNARASGTINNNSMSSGTTTTAPSSAAGSMSTTTTTERPARADRN